MGSNRSRGEGRRTWQRCKGRGISVLGGELEIGLLSQSLFEHGIDALRPHSSVRVGLIHLVHSLLFALLASMGRKKRHLVKDGFFCGLGALARTPALDLHARDSVSEEALTAKEELMVMSTFVGSCKCRSR